jgi:hypothetical protein
LGAEEQQWMWDAYAPGPESVMIVSSFADLCLMFEDTPQTIYLSAVSYVDSHDQPIEESNLFNAAIRELCA